MATRKTASKATVKATQPQPEPAQEEAVVLEATPPAPQVPPGYVARTVVWPGHFWRIFDRQAKRAGVTVDKWLERYLQHMARE